MRKNFIGSVFSTVVKAVILYVGSVFLTGAEVIMKKRQSVIKRIFKAAVVLAVLKKVDDLRKKS